MASKQSAGNLSNMSYVKARDLLELALFVSGRTGVTLADIEDRFECDRRKAQRMLAMLGMVFPQLDRIIDEERRPRWSLSPQAVIPLIDPTPDELVALANVADRARHEGDTATATQLRQLESKVRVAIPVRQRTRFEVDEEALLEATGLAIRVGPKSETRHEIDAALSLGLKARRTLRILYSSGMSASARWRTVEPHGLLLGTRRYLIARDTSKNTQRVQSYTVEKIEQVEVTADFFTPIDGFDIRHHAKRGFGSFEDENQHGKVVWRFAPRAADRAARFRFHPSQECEWLADGSLQVSFEASGHIEMAWHLYCWGTAVEVIEPAELRALVQDFQRDDFGDVFP